MTITKEQIDNAATSVAVDITAEQSTPERFAVIEAIADSNFYSESLIHVATLIIRCKLGLATSKDIQTTIGSMLESAIRLGYALGQTAVLESIKEK